MGIECACLQCRICNPAKLAWLLDPEGYPERGARDPGGGEAGGYTLSSSSSYVDDDEKDQVGTRRNLLKSSKKRGNGSKNRKGKKPAVKKSHGPSPMFYMPPSTLMNSRLHAHKLAPSDQELDEYSLNPKEESVPFFAPPPLRRTRRTSVFQKTKSRTNFDHESDMSSPRNFYL